MTAVPAPIWAGSRLRAARRPGSGAVAARMPATMGGGSRDEGEARSLRRRRDRRRRRDGDDRGGRVRSRRLELVVPVVGGRRRGGRGADRRRRPRPPAAARRERRHHGRLVHRARGHRRRRAADAGRLRRLLRRAGQRLGRVPLVAGAGRPHARVPGPALHDRLVRHRRRRRDRPPLPAAGAAGDRADPRPRPDAAVHHRGPPPRRRPGRRHRRRHAGARQPRPPSRRPPHGRAPPTTSSTPGRWPATGPASPSVASCVVGAVVAAPFLGPRLPLADAHERFDLRRYQVPPFDPLALPSPLVQVKANLKENRKDDVVFTITGDPVELWPVAVMTDYDGVVWTVGDPERNRVQAEFAPVDTELPELDRVDPARTRRRAPTRCRSATSAASSCPTAGVARAHLLRRARSRPPHEPDDRDDRPARRRPPRADVRGHVGGPAPGERGGAGRGRDPARRLQRRPRTAPTGRPQPDRRHRAGPGPGLAADGRHPRRTRGRRLLRRHRRDPARSLVRPAGPDARGPRPDRRLRGAVRRRGRR